MGNEELALFRRYIAELARHNADPEALAGFELDNTFYWFFILTDHIAFAYKTFERINEQFYQNRFTRPRITFSKRATGGYYDKRKHEIGISLAMTVEFGRPEFYETLLHELAHLVIQSHNRNFYALLEQLGGSGRKAPRTYLLELKRRQLLKNNYPVLVHCPNCLVARRYRNRRALRYACRACCETFAGGKFDTRFQLVLKAAT